MLFACSVSEFDFNLWPLVVSILTLIVAVATWILAWKIAQAQKNETVLRGFYDQFAAFLAYAAKPSKDKNEVLRLLICMKVTAGFLDKKLFKKFDKMLETIENLNLTRDNLSRDKDWDKIRGFLLTCIKSFNADTAVTDNWIKKHL